MAKKDATGGEDQGANESVEIAETLAGDGVRGTRPPAAPASRVERGRNIGRYVVLAVVGEGAMGVVYAAYDPELDRKIALKLLKPDGVGESEASAGRTRLLREAQAIAKLSHPNVVSIYDVGVLELDGSEQVYLAMEFVEGRSLGELLEEVHAREAWAQSDAWRELLERLVAAGQGLAAAHAAGIIHRDFKPENVLVGDDGRVRVVDFGLARRDADEGEGVVSKTEKDALVESISRSELGTDATRAGALVGTPAYMAPELYEGQTADARTDQFAFCVSLYEALFGQRPFRGQRIASLAFQITQGQVREPPARPRVPARLRRAIIKGLSVEPQGRHASMQDLLEELTRDPAAKLRRWAGVAGLATIGLGLAYAGFELTRPGDVEIAVTSAGQALRPGRVSVGEHELEVSDEGARGRVPAGLYRVAVDAPGFLGYEGVLEVSRGGHHELAVALEHEQGVFDLEVEPPGASIVVDGVDYGSRLRAVSFDTGDHEILLTKQGHYERELDWSVGLDETRSGFAFLPQAVIWSATATGINHDLLWSGDITGDGRADVFHKNYATLSAYDPWEDEGIWNLAIGDNIDQMPAFGDLDGDGALDVVAIRNSVARRGLAAWSSKPRGRRPTLLWERWRSPTGSDPTDISTARPALVDIDGDEDLDVVSTSGWRDVIAAYEGRTGRVAWIRRLESSGLALAATTEPEPTAFAVTHASVVRIDLRNGKSVWERPLPAMVEGEVLDHAVREIQMSTIKGYRWLETADLDGRGIPDAVVPLSGREQSGVRVFAGEDGELLWESEGEPVQWNLEGSNLIDLSGDGVPDLLMALSEKPARIGLIDGSTGQRLWIREGGQGVLRPTDPGRPPVVLVHTKQGIEIVDAATGAVEALARLEHSGKLEGTAFSDWDGDGEAELISTDGSRRLRIFDRKGRPEGSISLPVAARVIVPSGDMNGDGIDDLLIDASGPTVIAGPKVLWRRTAADALRATPVLDDLDGDGALEIGVFGALAAGDGLHVYDAATGELEAAAVDKASVIRGAVTLPAAGGGRDVVVHSFKGNKLVAYAGADASVVHRLDMETAYGAPGYGDVDGDGRQELIAVPWENGLIRVLDAQTWALEWTVPVDMGGWAQPVVAELDGKGPPELLVGFNDGYYRVYDGTTGAERWSVELGPLKVDNTGAVGDLDGDGDVEIVTTTADERFDLLVLDGATGRELRRFPGIGGVQAPIFHDCDGDEQVELIVPSVEHGVYCMEGDGAVRWRYRVEPPGDPDPVAVMAAVNLVDLDGDDHPELLTAFRDGSLRVLDAQTGELEWSFHTEHTKIDAQPLAGDVDGDGIAEVFVASWDRHLYALRVGR
jgi:outer membrane protein assembly factor BamB/tRNA A-37 threonylcarbamoyl transferase component Bud32